MSLLLEQDDEFFAMDVIPALAGKQNSSNLSAGVSNAAATTILTDESRGGVPFGRKGEVTQDVHISVTANELTQAYGTADVIPLSSENGTITNFRTTLGDSEMAENPDIPKIPTKVKVDQVTINGTTKPLFLECTSFAAVEDEKALELKHSGSKSVLENRPPFGSLIIALKENTVADRIQSKSIPLAVLGHAHEYGTLPLAIRKTYMQHPRDPTGVLIDVSNPQPYLADYNNHEDVIKGHYIPVTDDDIKHANLKNG